MEYDGNGGSCNEGLSSTGNLVVIELGSEGERVMVELVRNIVVKVKRWCFIGEVSGLEVPLGFRVEVRPGTRRLQDVIVGVVGVKV